MQRFMTILFWVMLMWICYLFAKESHAATTPRGWWAPYMFRKYNACPGTGKFDGPCPGWIMDHMESLRCGGRDVPENIWWQTIEEARVKDQQEDECWRYYKGPRNGYPHS